MTMGFKIKILFLILCGIIFELPRVTSAHAASEINIRSEYHLQDERVASDQISSLDPDHLNPHLQRWVVSKYTEISGLKSFPKGKGKFGVRASEVLTALEGHIRGPGPWYRKYDEFQCTRAPDSWFGTEEGAKAAADQAATLWVDLLKEERTVLALLLSRVSEVSGVAAEKKGAGFFKSWLRSVERRWRTQVYSLARNTEWRFYLDQATQEGFCPKSTNSASEMRPPTRREMMEPLNATPPKPKLLARAPARLWEGLFSIRLNISMAGKMLSGRFLIDSGLNKSVMSPDWLESQGVYSAWVIEPFVPPQQVNWGILGDAESSMAMLARVDRVEASGFTLPMKEFLVANAHFFSPPETVGYCCDGVLGKDFLRSFPIEFDAGTPSEVRIYSKDGFQWAPDAPWIEASETQGGHLASACAVSQSLNKKHGKVLPGVSWSTGSETSMIIHQPYSDLGGGSRESDWNIFCDSFRFAENVPAVPAASLGSKLKSAILTSKVPAVTVGMPLLSRGKVTFDLPHGRIWFDSKENFNKKFYWKNRTGLKLKFVLEDGDRVLRVVQVQKNRHTDGLFKGGLRAGMQVTQVDGIPAEDLDYWEVENRLAGKLGNTVTLQWKTKQGLKMAPVRVRGL